LRYRVLGFRFRIEGFSFRTVDSKRVPGSCELKNLGLVIGFRRSGLVFMA